MNKFWKATLINVIAVFAVTALLSIGNGKGAFLILPVVLAFLEFLGGLFLLIFPATRRASQIMLAASGIVFLIGLSICSISPLNMNFH